MRELNEKIVKKVSGGADCENDRNSVEYTDSSGLYGTVVVPPSTKGQTAHVTLQVIENNFLNQLFK